MHRELQPDYTRESVHGGRRTGRKNGVITMVCAAVSVVAALGVTGFARADWPANKHDAQRSATADRESRIVRPGVRWRHYLGGALNQNQLAYQDVDGDGTQEVLLVSSGRLISKKATDSVVWQTAPLQLNRLDAVVDLDGNSTPEVLVSGALGIHVVELASGKVLWSLPAGHIGTVGAVRVADFDHDSRPDVYVADLACGSLGSLGDAAEAWSFAQGISSPKLLFQLERKRRDYSCGLNDAIADVDGDGQLEIVAQGSEYFYVYSGIDGSLRSRSDSVGSIPYGEALVELGNTDGSPGAELVCYANTNYAAPFNSRRVFLLDWDPDSGRLVKRWEVSAADLTRDRHAFGTGGLGDLGGDGSLEVVTSFYHAATDDWTTVVLDAATGTQRASVPRGPFRGLAELDGNPGPEVVVGDRTQGTSVLKWMGAALSAWFRAGRFEPLGTRAADATAPTAATTKLFTFDLDRTAPADLIGLSFGVDETNPEALIALSGGSNSPREVARRSFDEAVSILVSSASSRLTRDYPQIVITRSDGYLWALDDRLAPTNTSPQSRGLRVGGYYSGIRTLGRAPLAADLDGDGASEVVVMDSRDAVLGLNTLGASPMKGPTVRWELAGGYAPLLVDVDRDKVFEVAYWTTAPNAAALRVYRGADATRLWQRTIGSIDIAPANDLMSGDVNGDGQIDIVYSGYSGSGGALHINAADGRTGAPLWANDYESVVAGSGVGAGSLYDRSGKGASDVLAAPRDQLQWIDGASGAGANSVNAGYANYGLFGNFDDDPAPEFIGVGALFGVNSFELNLSPRWNKPDTNHSRINGVAVQCAAGSVYVAGYDASARVSVWSTANGDVLSDVVLHNGKALPLTDLSTTTSRVGDVTASRNLTGNGKPGVLVPSSDGHLYALDPCENKLLWALDLGAPVGEAIWADTDGDGEDEIIATAADGFLYGIDAEDFPPPTFVYENDGTSLATSPESDLDLIETADSISANWASVPGATSYQYAVIAADGAFLTKPNFVDAGTATNVTVRGLTLKLGAMYRVAVRALGPTGTSPEVVSDGATVVADPCTSCGEGTICESRMCIAEDGSDGGDEDAGAEADAGTDEDAGSCSYCGKGTRCDDGICVAKRHRGGCCSVLGEHGPATGAYLFGLLGAVIAWRRRHRG